MLRLGAFEIPNVPGVYGAPVSAVEKEVGVSLDGFAGSGLFATFRITFANEGRTLWMEDLPPYVIEMRREAAAEFRRAREEKAKQALELTAPSPQLTAPSPLVGGDPPPSPSEKAAP